mmetsp:Transcript_1681/g.2969  ORF Transcript_1681/g.2969 Transcript_1681/m.2969 type:complete len:601 (+) Transcript_1681:302-2104(+)
MVIFQILLYLNKFRNQNHEEQEKSLMSALRDSASNQESQGTRQKLIDLHTISQNPDLLVDKEITARVYSEIDIAEHSIMLRGFSLAIPAEKLEQALTKAFTEILKQDNIDEGQLLAVHVASELHKCQKWTESLKKLKGKLEKTQEINRKKDSEGEDRLKLNKRMARCRGTREVDAEEHYKAKIQKLNSDIELEERRMSIRNSGFAFVVFRSKQISMRFKIDNYLKEKLKRTSVLYELQNTESFNLLQMRSQPAYLESDLKWENLAKDPFKASLKRMGLFALLILFSFVVLTPAYAVSLLTPLQYTLSDWFKQIGFVSQLISAYFQPLIVIFVNFVIIPSLVDLSVTFEDHKRESSIQVTIIRRIYFFMILNTLLMPITETSTAVLFFENLEDQKIQDWPSMLSSNLMAQQYFYTNFIIQLTFITNGFTLLDVPHRMTHWIKRKLYERRHKHSLYKEEFVDDYVFDLGYNQSYCLVIYLNCLLFSTIVPLIPMFASLYFYIKYLVDKYNLVFVYFRRFESGGKIKASVKNHMVFNLAMYMIVTVSFFALKFSDLPFSWLGPIFIILWTLFFIQTSRRLQVEQSLETTKRISQSLKTLEKER